MRRRCLGCGSLIASGSRCARCERERRAKYHGDWPERSRAAIAAHRAQHGDVCPGWRRQPHEIDPADWTTDHQLGPLCRSCNTRKRTLAGS